MNPDYISRRRKRELNRPEQQSSEFWVIDNEKLDKDVRKRLEQEAKPQNYLTEHLGIARSTFWRIYQGKKITMDVFLKLMQWLEADLNEYIIKN